MSKEKNETPEGARVQMGELKDFFKFVEEDHKKRVKKDEDELDVHSPEFLRQT